jgi:hypothetical protein
MKLKKEKSLKTCLTTGHAQFAMRRRMHLSEYKSVIMSWGKGGQGLNSAAFFIDRHVRPFYNLLRSQQL